MNTVFCFLFLLCVNYLTYTLAVPVAGAATAANGTLPYGTGNRTVKFPDASWDPDSTISMKKDFETFFVSAPGLMIVAISLNINNHGCDGYTYIVLYDVNYKKTALSWTTLDPTLSKVFTFYVLASSQYQLQLQACPGGKSSVDNVAISWIQPASA